MAIKKAMILAAGKGTRLGEYTKNTPKPLVKINNTCALQRILKALTTTSVEEVVINLHTFPEQIKQAVESYDLPFKVHLIEEKEILETGGGIKNALSLLGNEPFYVINGDVVWLEEKVPLLKRLEEHFDKNKMDSLLTLVPVEKTLAFRLQPGDFFQNADGTLSRPPKGEHAPFVYAGIQIMQASLIAHENHGHFTLLPCYEHAITKDKLHGILYTGDWVDMGSPKGLHEAENLLKNIANSAVA